MTITVFLKTGEGKIICDDSLLIDNQVIDSDEVIVFSDMHPLCIAVADGVGGNAGGHDASMFILQHIAQSISSLEDGTQIQKFLIETNRELIEFASKFADKANMATTLTGIFEINNCMYVAHVGNTRLYTLQGNYLKQITADHTTYQWLMMHGNYQEADSCNKSEIISCFGGGSADLLKMLTVTQPFEEYEPAVLVLTSDGIHDHIDIDSFEEILSENIPMRERLEKAWRLAKEKGSADDCSIIVMEK